MQFSTTKADVIADNIDKLITIDFHARGIVKPIYEEARRIVGEPLAMAAAKHICIACSSVRPLVVIGTGFIIRSCGMPETDGLTGAALLARGLFLAYGAISLIVTEEEAAESVEAVLGAAGIKVVPSLDLAKTLHGSAVIIPWPKDTAQAKALALDICSASPSLFISIERPGVNEFGVHHNSAGLAMSDITATIDDLFLEAGRKGIPRLAIGDMGNELGMGIVSEAVARYTPYGSKCRCGCGGGIGCTLAAEATVVGAVSDDAAYGVLACLAHLTSIPAVLPDPDLAIGVLEAAVRSGAVDGLTGKKSLSIDVLGVEVHRAILQLMRAVLDYADSHTAMRPEFLDHLGRLVSG